MVVLMLRHANGYVDLDGAAKLGWDWRLGAAMWMGTRSSIGIYIGFVAGSGQPLNAFHQPREFNFLCIGLYNFSILNVYSICRSPPRKMYPQIELVGLHLD
ncbi:hypothetical protein CASFOL_001528 [Castilleja foliolosa]|uniref:Uncharacterized protein n=1 Tax=Castilleja foliolosa TaxID=1961234 RepID=A0ABD3EJR8_9LAMI